MGPLLILGLGNPGLAYEGTRHNVGFSFVDALARRMELSFVRKGAYALASLEGEGRGLLLCKPFTFMNASGKVLAPLRKLYRFSEAESLLVVTDNVDLPVGRVRLKVGSSGSTHNGLRSISECLSGGAYARLLVGVGSPKSGQPLSAWVLSRFSKSEESDLARVFSFLLDQLACVPASWDNLRQAVNSFR